MTTNTRQASRHNEAGYKGIQWVLLAFMLLVALTLAFIVIRPVKVLPIVAPAPSYQLIDQNGQPISDDDLQGSVVLYDFVYTHCTTVCPAMTAEMLQVQKRLEAEALLGNDVVLASITFDPERDTPARLKAYADQMNTAPDAWWWMTGDLVAIKQLVGGEFGVYFEKIALDPAAAEALGHDDHDMAAEYDFVHATVFTLVDHRGRIRAEYQQLLDTDQVMRDIRLLLREEHAGPLLHPVLQAAHALRAYP